MGTPLIRKWSLGPSNMSFRATDSSFLVTLYTTVWKRHTLHYTVQWTLHSIHYTTITCTIYITLHCVWTHYSKSQPLHWKVAYKTSEVNWGQVKNNRPDVTSITQISHLLLSCSSDPYTHWTTVKCYHLLYPIRQFIFRFFSEYRRKRVRGHWKSRIVL